MNNNDKISSPISQEQIDLVWNKAFKVPGYDADLFRKDRYGSWITKNMYSETNEYVYFGWGVSCDNSQGISGVHVNMDMLLPLNWENIKEESGIFIQKLSMASVD